MKRYLTGKFNDTDVNVENIENSVWEKPITKESPQTIRNMSSISQLKSEQTEIKKDVKQLEKIIKMLSSSTQWPKPKITLPIHFPFLYKAGRTPNIILDLEDRTKMWLEVPTAKNVFESVPEDVTLPYQKSLSKISKLLVELEEDFDEIASRIVRCEFLEKELAAFEESLEDDETQYLAWCVSLIRDVLDYNYAEDLTEIHMGLLKKAIGLIHDKSTDCNKEDYQNLHTEFLSSGLTLIPTSRKAIDKYGE